MIIFQQAPQTNAWFRAACFWPFSLTLVTCIGWALLDYLHIDPIRLWPLVLAIGQGTLLLYLMGRWAGPPTRVTRYAAIIGGFGYLPLLLALLLPASVLILGAEQSSIAVAAKLAWVPLLVCWVVFNVRQVSRRALDSPILDNAAAAAEHALVVDRARLTALDEAGGRFDYVSAFLFVLAVPMLYLAPRLADGYNGPGGTLLQVATFATPLAIHVLGHLARATYLWLYLPWKLEQKHGRPVLLHQRITTPKTEHGK